MRFNVDALRVILVVVNLAGVVGMIATGGLFFFGETGESQAKLVSPDSYDVPAAKGNRTTRVRWEAVKRNFNRKPEVKFEQKTEDLPTNIAESGPLDGFEITNMAIFNERPAVWIAEKEETGGLNRPGMPRGGRTTRPPVRRSAGSASSAARKGSKLIKRAEPKGALLYVGDEYKNAGTVATITEIHVLEEFIIYEVRGNPHRLRKPASQSTMDEREGGWVLHPVEDEDELSAMSEIDENRRGAISTPNSKKAPTKRPNTRKKPTNNNRTRKIPSRRGSTKDMRDAAKALDGVSGKDAEALKRILREEEARQNNKNQQN